MATQTIDPLAVVRDFTTLGLTLTSAVPACVEQWKKPDRPATASKGGRVTKNGKPRSIATSRSPSVQSSRSSPKTPSNVTTSSAMASTPSASSSSRSPVAGANSILPYRMHVSQRYLDLTRQKLGLTRLPREPRTRQQQWYVIQLIPIHSNQHRFFTQGKTPKGFTIRMGKAEGPSDLVLGWRDDCKCMQWLVRGTI